jgi:hypothetical protein
MTTNRVYLQPTFMVRFPVFRLFDVCIQLELHDNGPTTCVGSKIGALVELDLDQREDQCWDFRESKSE